MSDADNFRTQTSQGPARRANVFGWVAGMLGVFVAGIIFVFAWNTLQLYGLAPRFSPEIDRIANFSIAASADRIGRPATAPVLRHCIWKAMDIDPAPGQQPSLMYAAIRAGSTRLSFQPGRDGWDAKDAKDAAVMWGMLASCITAHDGPVLCDRDNRAVAVEASTKFLQYAPQAIPLFDRNESDDRARLDEIASMKRHTLESLQAHIRDGIFIASDFGFFPQEDIGRIVSKRQRTRDLCKQASG